MDKRKGRVEAETPKRTPSRLCRRSRGTSRTEAGAGDQGPELGTG